jgi:hypothetical protein
VAAWILWAMSALHAASALLFGVAGSTPTYELAGFIMGTTASVLMVGAVLSYGLTRLRGAMSQGPPR